MFDIFLIHALLVETISSLSNVKVLLYQLTYVSFQAISVISVTSAVKP